MISNHFIYQIYILILKHEDLITEFEGFASQEFLVTITNKHNPDVYDDYYLGAEDD